MDRTYLWVCLTLDLIESDIDIDKIGIVNATSHLPKSVYEAYDRIISKSCNLKKGQEITTYRCSSSTTPNSERDGLGINHSKKTPVL